MKKKAVVIGSRIGGSAIGALLASQGSYDVTLIEKNDFICGRLAGFEKDGFRIETGCDMVFNCEKDPLGEILSICGCPDYVKWRSVRRPSHVINYGGKLVKFPLEAYRLGFSLIDMLDLLKFHNAVSAMSPDECDRCMDVSVREFADRFVDNDLARTIIGLLAATCFAAPCHQVPLGEYARCWNNIFMNKAPGYPLGGTVSVTEAYCRIIRENGGAVMTGMGVDQILIRDGRAVGVRLRDNTVIDADLVISTADIREALLWHVKNGCYPPDYVAGIQGCAYSGNTHSIKIALDRPVTDETMVFDINTGEFSLNEQFTGEPFSLPDSASLLMISVASNIDPTAAPEGKQLIIAGSASREPFPSSPEIRQQRDRNLMASVKKVFPGIEDHILWTVSRCGASGEAMNGNNGNVTGDGKTNGQAGPGRPPVSDRYVENLYHCSANTGLFGIGGETAADSALRLFARLGGGTNQELFRGERKKEDYFCTEPYSQEENHAFIQQDWY